MTDDIDYENVPDNALFHEGILRKSGRYPWGSGETPNQRNKDFLDHVNALKKKGMSEVEIARGLGEGVTTADIRNARAIAQNQLRKAQVSQAERLKATGMSNVAAAREMGINESSFRSLLDENRKDRTDQLEMHAQVLRDAVKDKKYVDIGEGIENSLGISNSKLKTVVAVLKEEGYEVIPVKVPQAGTDKLTRLKVLAPPGTTWAEVNKNKADIRPPMGSFEDYGSKFRAIKPPVSFESSRLGIRYKEDGGEAKDGVLELRRGVDDISLGGKLYAQVRVKVDDSHYLKGMAMYADDLPAGVDIRFNTNKSNTGNKLDALKKIKGDDEENPFGAITKQKYYVDKDGKEHQSKMNVVYEEGEWDKWGKSLSSQVLSKQSVSLAQEQLKKRFDEKQKEYDEIMSLTNPTVRKKLLEGFAEDADSSAVHLKAAAMPRQRTQVILPITGMKDHEIYAPNFNDGEQVVLIRYPHGGKFEIPELTVNNRHPGAEKLIKNAADAVGISSKVAERLSGADFDGDTVVVIPNNSKKFKTEPPLRELKGFDPKAEYPKYEGMPEMTARSKQRQMGDVSNLITDMTIAGAPFSEIAKAVKHSMVVIDAEKHELNWRQSAKDNGISELKRKYQGGPRAGAQTLVSRASSQKEVNARGPRPAAEGGKIDRETGKLVYKYTGEGRIVPGSTKTLKNGKVVETPDTFKPTTIKSTHMAETDDAYSLVSKDGTAMEHAYADHANKLKALANTARKSYINTPNLVWSPTAKAAYAPQVKTLQSKVKVAVANKPLERQAQLLANALIQAEKDNNPNMDRAELKKIKGRALNTARDRVGAKKKRVDITPIEWEAIQSGAISNNFLNTILANSDEKLVKSYAMPRTKEVMSSSKTVRARSMLSNGHTQAEVAQALGVSVSTLNASLAPAEGA